MVAAARAVPGRGHTYKIAGRDFCRAHVQFGTSLPAKVAARARPGPHLQRARAHLHAHGFRPHTERGPPRRCRCVWFATSPTLRTSPASGHCSPIACRGPHLTSERASKTTRSTSLMNTCASTLHAHVHPSQTNKRSAYAYAACCPPLLLGAAVASGTSSLSPLWHTSLDVVCPVAPSLARTPRPSPRHKCAYLLLY